MQYLNIKYILKNLFIMLKRESSKKEEGKHKEERGFNIANIIQVINRTP